jgi:tetratricopeptide (TPR) repeat protein
VNKTLNISGFTSKQLHEKGSNFREKDNHLEALQCLDAAIVGYQRDGDYRGIVDVLKDRVLTWKHYFLLTSDEVYAIFAKMDAEAMLSVAKMKKLEKKLATSYFRLGEVEMLFINYKKAVYFFKKSLKHYEGSVSEKGDYRYHLGEALYRLGKKSEGKKTMLKGLNEIERGKGEIPSFVVNVWKSGCYARLADLLREDEPEVARKYLLKTEEIVNSDDRLIIRKRQLAELKKKFKN